MDFQLSPIPESELEHLVTPFFRHQTIENVPQSEIQQRPVMDVREVVELRFAGDQKYSPVFPADAMYRREGHRVITYAERFAEPYRAWQNGEDQAAAGTPLEMLVEYGITPSQISLCRVAKVYSIEALDSLEGQNLKTLGQSVNVLKDMARRYMADRTSRVTSIDKVAELEAEIARLKAANPVPVVDPSPAAIEEARQVADDEYANLTDDELKSLIADKLGSRPRGNPSRATLIHSLRDLDAA